MIRKLQKDSQLFYTTHNHDVLDIQLPTHSFAFLHKDNERTVIEQPEKLNFTKNDRNLQGYVRCNYFNTMPSTHLLDALWGNDWWNLAKHPHPYIFWWKARTSGLISTANSEQFRFVWSIYRSKTQPSYKINWRISPSMLKLSWLQPSLMIFMGIYALMARFLSY